MMEYPLLQRVMINGSDIHIEHIIDGAYIETCDLSGPKLILNIDDEHTIYRDEVGIEASGIVEVEFADPDGRGDEVWIDTFIIVTAPSQNAVVTVNAIQTDCHQLKQPAKHPRFYVDQAPADILADLLPGLVVDADTIDVFGTYHLNPGMTPARLLRDMARDYAALIWLNRGTVYFRLLDSLPGLKTSWHFERGNHEADVTIAKYALMSDSALYDRITHKSYIQWDTVAGLERSETHADEGDVYISVPFYSALNNQSRFLMPFMVTEMLGNGQFEPGRKVEVSFHRLSHSDSPLDESIPADQYIQQVTHYQRGSRYLCKTELGVMHD
ncbi:hypothetical protein [Thaumasiovibrio sp. DFM-14]|uniref:hypothetical protein n=1 Tax=Thaumasiovibrio sp. DFM-14 TaxID=3384792 RepID=UPI0039A138E5